jgi:hypothetical protein
MGFNLGKGDGLIFLGYRLVRSKVEVLRHLAGSGFELGNADNLWQMVKAVGPDISSIALYLSRLRDLRDIRRRKCCSVHCILSLRCHTLTKKVSRASIKELRGNVLEAGCETWCFYEGRKHLLFLSFR